MSPDERRFRDDLGSAAFQIGAMEGRWGINHKRLSTSANHWPKVVLWVASTLELEFGKYFFNFDLANYPIDPPTGTFWDPSAEDFLPFGKRPKISGRGEKVFRTDWENGRALYHPYDRIASNSHPGWKTQYPHLVWDRNNTITDLLHELNILLN